MPMFTAQPILVVAYFHPINYVYKFFVDTRAMPEEPTQLLLQSCNNTGRGSRSARTQPILLEVLFSYHFMLNVETCVKKMGEVKLVYVQNHASNMHCKITHKFTLIQFYSIDH